MNRYDDDDSDSAFDSRGILRDGARYRVPMTMRDSSPASRRVTDGFGAGGDALHKPGYRRQVDANRALVDAAYREKDFADANAWRVDAEETWGTVGAQCTVREGGRDEGAPGHLRRVGNRLVCVPDEGYRTDNRTVDGRTVDARPAAYATYDNELREAWRG